MASLAHNDRPVDRQMSEDKDEKVDLLRVVALFAGEWRTGLLAVLIAFVLGTIFIVRLPSEYEAMAVILPKDQPTGASNFATLFAGARGPANNYVSLLLSRTLRDDVIRRADLMSYFGYSSQEAARGRVYSMTTIISSDTIAVRVRDRNAQMAARIANAYVGALRSLQESMATSQSEVQRRFFEQQLQKEKDALAVAEQELQRTQINSGVIQMDTQTQIGLSAIASARSQITALTVRLAALLQSSTEQNPEVRTLRSQIAQLQLQERQLENGAGGSGVGAAAPAGRMPQVNLDYGRKQREVRYHEALVSSLANHFEGLRIGSGAGVDTFDIIDSAVVPEAPTWPPRRLYLLLAAGAALLFGLLSVALKLLAGRVLADPIQRSHLYSIRQNFRWSR